MKKYKNLRSALACLSIACLSAIGVPALAQAPNAAAAYPNKPVRIVVPYSAGGPVDALLRAMAPLLADEWKQPVVVENRTGANEIIGADFVAKAPPDGYTILAATEAALSMSQHLYKRLPFDPERDLVPVSQLVTLPMALIVPASSPAKTVKEFIALAAARKDRPLTYGSTGAGGITHLPMAMFEYNENIHLLHVPYKGAANVVPDMIAGNIDAAVLAVTPIEQHVKAGTIRALAISAPTRATLLPGVPTFAEAGVKDIQASFFIGLMAPKGTPPAIVEKIASSSRKILLRPEFRSKYVDPYSYAMVASAPADFQSFLTGDRRIQGERVKISGVSLD